MHLQWPTKNRYLHCAADAKDLARESLFVRILRRRLLITWKAALGIEDAETT